MTTSCKLAVAKNNKQQYPYPFNIQYPQTIPLTLSVILLSLNELLLWINIAFISLTLKGQTPQGKLYFDKCKPLPPDQRPNLGIH